MPLCTCGCNQELTRRAIKNHLHGRAVPHLVTAAVKASHAFDPTVSPPRLNPSKKLRSSRRYFPSSPTSGAAYDGSNVNFPMSESDGAAGDGDVGMRCEERLFVDDAGIQCAIDIALEDVWSGLHHDDDSTEEEDDDDEGNDEEGEDTEGGDGGDGWELYDECESGLSGLHMLGEDFERNVAANGELMMADIPICQLTI